MLRSIRFKILLAIVLGLAAGGAVIVSLVNLSHKKVIDGAARDATRVSIAAFDNQKEAEVKAIKTAMEMILLVPEFRQALAAKDRERLLAWETPFYKHLKAKYDITNWNNWDPDGVFVLRMTKPEQFGDKVQRWSFDESRRTNDWASDLDLGFQGFALRVVAPVFDDAAPGEMARGNRVGFFELGMNITRFLDSMKHQTGNEYAIVIKKDVLDEKRWAATRESEKRPNNWADQKDIVVSYNTTSDETLFRYPGDLSSLPDGGRVLEVVRRGDRTFVRSVFPIKASGGKKSAAIFVLTDVSGQVRDAQAMQVKVVGAIVGVMVLLLLAFVIVFNQLIVSRLRRMIDTATAVVGGDFERKIPVSSDDEIGQFEGLFDQFRQVFVSVAKKVEEPAEQAAPPADKPADEKKPE